MPFTTPLDPTPIEIRGVLKSVTDRTALSCAIRKGADGKLYAENDLRNHLVRIKPTTAKIDIFEPTPLNPLSISSTSVICTLLRTVFESPLRRVILSPSSSPTPPRSSGATLARDLPAPSSGSLRRFPRDRESSPLSLPVEARANTHSQVWVGDLVANRILRYDPASKQTNEYFFPELF